MTDKGALAADHVVLALGSYSPVVGRKVGLKLPVYPIKGYSVTLPIDGYNGAPEVGGVDENNLVAWCKMGARFRLTADRRVLRLRNGPPAVRLRRHAPHGARSVSRRRRITISPSYWACLSPMTPEGTPIFGRGRHQEPLDQHRPGPYGLDDGVRLRPDHRGSDRRAEARDRYRRAWFTETREEAAMLAELQSRPAGRPPQPPVHAGRGASPARRR